VDIFNEGASRGRRQNDKTLHCKSAGVIYLYSMKKVLFIALLSVCFQAKINAQTIFEIDERQSMLMTGKGPGQDATINPFQGEDCYAIIENLGKELFSVRIQEKGKIIEIIKVKPKKKMRIKLLSGQELYLDGETKNRARASVSYERFN